MTAGNITPGLWVRGWGTWLDRDDQASTTAFGRTYKYNLDRDLDLGTVQGGVDFGSRGVLAESDALLYGLLGGAVFGELTYDQLARTFDIDGGEVGGYVTYLNGGLYIDNLLKATFTEFDASANSGIPGLDSTVWGFRSDGGYRFGAPRQGAFFEPQATIAAAWIDMDNFTLAGNSVKFGDETDVRGRLGLRVGTSRLTRDGGVIEPFVVGSLWATSPATTRRPSLRPAPVSASPTRATTSGASSRAASTSSPRAAIRAPSPGRLHLRRRYRRLRRQARHAL
jgi:outer membrane autotransporter protein